MNYRAWPKRLAALFAGRPGDRAALIELLRDAERRNLLDRDALAMTEGALQVSEFQARDIMIPRVQMTVIEHEAEPEAILSVVVESGHSRFPVMASGGEEVAGILLAKDLLGYFARPDEKFDIKDLMRPAVFIPESKRLNVLLREFRNSRNHMAVVIDEYSAVAGLVTIEDVIEEIIGEIADEHDLEQEEINISAHEKDRYTVRALTPVAQFNKYFEAAINAGEYDTIGGYVVNAFGHLPKRGETIELDGFRIKILRADKRRVKLLLVTRAGLETTTGAGA